VRGQLYDPIALPPRKEINFLICIVGGGVQTGSTQQVGHLLAYCTCPGWLWGWRIWWNEWQGKPKYSENTCPDATLSTTNPTWPVPGLNPGRRGGKPATNRFSYGAASGKRYMHPLYTRLGGFHKRSGRYGEENKLTPVGNRTPPLQPAAIPTELSRFLWNTNIIPRTAQEPAIVCSLNLMLLKWLNNGGWLERDT
jgi:hypothetical protein